ncbi:hypothetical protein L228DRAFT_270517 [Xylona heveae TC161]|uniref:Uncharacterized protein n=1 Tax=Xylona heveae (strain CBS 132557 / TC161) TaxID=1328760 RepID=A0A165AGS7_XYLHT|nr:hypothetical protein L228DRAFT_270517 [Xylona heveae TC161]KZF20446.1 hypothetical protein L228DRAFT_270517 [Xylona heveae TC161]
MKPQTLSLLTLLALSHLLFAAPLSSSSSSSSAPQVSTSEPSEDARQLDGTQSTLLDGIQILSRNYISLWKHSLLALRPSSSDEGLDAPCHAQTQSSDNPDEPDESNWSDGSDGSDEPYDLDLYTPTLEEPEILDEHLPAAPTPSRSFVSSPSSSSYLSSSSSSYSYSPPNEYTAQHSNRPSECASLLDQAVLLDDDYDDDHGDDDCDSPHQMQWSKVVDENRPLPTAVLLEMSRHAAHAAKAARRAKRPFRDGTDD